jgi:phosphatidate cytidylyltransferase
LSIARPMLQRLLTAGVLTPIVVYVVLYLPTAYLAFLLGALVCLGAHEWSGFIGLRRPAWRWIYVAAVAACLLLSWFLIAAVWNLVLLAIAALWWVAVALTLTRIDHVEATSAIDLWLIPVGLLVLVPPWIALVRLHDLGYAGPWLVMSLLMLIWIADSVAYFSGRRWGRRKLAPVLSPGKTWAGVYGALIGALLWGLLLVAHLPLSASGGALLLLLCAATALLSIVGDLFESLIKRRRGLKDAGSILPGHGGVLDRIDSMTAAAPLFALGLLWLEKGL